MNTFHEDQKVEQFWETPTHDQIVEISKAHVEALESSSDDAIWVQVGMHHVLLHTIGRISGREHKCALPVWRDADGHRIVVGSFAGATREPDWVANLRDRNANPMVRVLSQSGAFWSDHQFLEHEERETSWSKLCADRAWYDDYQAMTNREIPLIRLPETELIPSEA
jgi:deazaflavin-dependent oxidoreductase (nitroreductase family)